MLEPQAQVQWTVAAREVRGIWAYLQQTIQATDEEEEVGELPGDRKSVV